MPPDKCQGNYKATTQGFLQQILKSPKAVLGPLAATTRYKGVRVTLACEARDTVPYTETFRQGVRNCIPSRSYEDWLQERQYVFNHLYPNSFKHI